MNSLTIWTIFYGFLIFWSVVCFILTFYKKKEIMNKFKNISYSKITENIYSLISLNMFIYVIMLIYNITFKYQVAKRCINPQSIKCITDKSQEKNVTKLQNLVYIITRLLSMSQIYEWMIIRIILLWQSGKNQK